MFDGEVLNFWAEEEPVELKQTETMKTMENGREEGAEMRAIGRENINFEVLAKYFGMPIIKAAKELKVGVTFLKKRCRELNIPRWPHRKMKSMEALIRNVKEIGREEGLVEESLKAAVDILEQERRVMEEKPRMELEATTRLLRQACFKANYKRRKLLSMSSNQLSLTQG